MCIQGGEHANYVVVCLGHDVECFYDSRGEVAGPLLPLNREYS